MKITSTIIPANREDLFVKMCTPTQPLKSGCAITLYFQRSHSEAMTQVLLIKQ